MRVSGLACQVVLEALLPGSLFWALVKSTLLLQLLLLLFICLTLVAQLAFSCPYDTVLAQWPSMEVAQTRFPGCCAPEFFDCRPAGGGFCIPLNKFHDGKVDCVDGSDESCFPGQIRCGHYCANSTHLGECLRNPYCDPLSHHTSTQMPQIIIPAISQAEASFCPLLRRKLCGLPNTISCMGYGECIFIKWLMDGKRDCLDGSDEEPSYAVLFKVLAYVGNPIQPAAIALLGANPVPTRPFFVPILPIAPVLPTQQEVYTGIEPITQRPYYWMRTSASSLQQPLWSAESTSKVTQPVESTGTKHWEGPIVDDFGSTFGPSTFALTSMNVTTLPSSSELTTAETVENGTISAADHKPTQTGWPIYPSSPTTGYQPTENRNTYNSQSRMPTTEQGGFQAESVSLDSFYPVDLGTNINPVTTIGTSSSEAIHLHTSSTEKKFPFVPFVFTFPPTVSTTNTASSEATTTSTGNKTTKTNVSSTAIQKFIISCSHTPTRHKSMDSSANTFIVVFNSNHNRYK